MDERDLRKEQINSFVLQREDETLWKDTFLNTLGSCIWILSWTCFLSPWTGDGLVKVVLVESTESGCLKSRSLIPALNYDMPLSSRAYLTLVIIISSSPVCTNPHFLSSWEDTVIVYSTGVIHLKYHLKEQLWHLVSFLYMLWRWCINVMPNHYLFLYCSFTLNYFMQF